MAAKAEQALHQLGALGAHQTGHTQDLALADGEAGMAEALGVNGGEVFHLEYHLAGNVFPGGVQVGQLPAHHLGDDEVGGQLLGGPGADVLAVPHDGNFVADAEDLVHFMADIDDGNALGPQLVHNGEQGLHLGGGQGGRGLVQNQHLAVGGYGLGDLHQLHLGHTQGAQLGRGVKIQVDLLQHLGGVLIHLVVVHHGDGSHLLGGIPAHVDVFADAALGNGLQLLMDHGDAPVQGIQRSLDLYGFSLVDDFALVHVINAEHAFHQRGLAGAVFTHQGVNGAGAELQLRVVKRLDAGERFDDATHFQTIF